MALTSRDAIAPGCADETCPVARAVGVLDGKWTMLIIRDLLGGVRRFTELRTSLSGISPKTLTDRLRELEDKGLVTRTIHAEIPPRVEYRLTETGQQLKPVVEALAVWGASLMGASRQARPPTRKPVQNEAEADDEAGDAAAR
jgi:DNA-binding HxlR family transcriptional regulator